ncbi:MAG: molybdenum ABC transporter ATP-binding protein, partial [Bauldia sp.]|nr:molybdenum ABC transporter ATP-binding protein [Bauldia sp.]
MARPPVSEGLDVRLAGTLGAFALDAAFTAPGRGVTALFGRSGSGKTSILRAVAGLQRLDGRVSLGSDVWQEGARFVPPHKRPVGYVFQEASLFPHLSVAQNLAFGRRRALRGGASEEVRHADIVELLGLGRLLDRSPAKLSGGERQRVAVGRALLSQPRLLLMDEPLSGLDAVSKEEILPYFEALHETLAIPALYVSHDLAEITRLADHLVVLDKGRVLAAGPLAHVLLQRLPGVFGLGRSSVLYARVRSYDEREELTELDLAGQPLLAVGRAGATGGLVRVRIAASDVSLSPGAPSRTTILNTLRARIVSIEPLAGGQVSVGLALDSAEPD